ncbi:Uncharacterised protein [Mycobacteroides abscessus subsp. abscessus]|nr:Uncharacterised protein [Mycobacteroides abscessus subsp. abscessus]SKM15355.1 Uncharacterised protein [Mycobacteroides abscessus subsp. massiliense]SIK23280.1 Uncharacterised protein [Mycobacteroides abscessus subsp. abscessus]SIM52077.1 Uncharacterised protein [Mycobacteroides abscessus subsp. abscessus]SKM93836.1 Uncharacterised protein [Mycobacteroides abscessus subsp. massiliense]
MIKTAIFAMARAKVALLEVLLQGVQQRGTLVKSVAPYS